MRVRLLMLFTPLFFFSNFALAVFESEQMAKVTIQSSVGRIITLETIGENYVARSACSATLIEKNVILTAAHCLYIESIMTKEEQDTLLTLNYSIEKYFDIPDITSQMSNQDLATIANSKINSLNGKKLKDYLSTLPKIEAYAVSDYVQLNPSKNFDTYFPRNQMQTDELKAMKAKNNEQTVRFVTQDYGFARLSKPIPNAKPLKIAPHSKEQKLYVAGFDGGVAGTTTLAVQMCDSDEMAMDIIYKDLMSQLGVLHLARLYGDAEPNRLKSIKQDVEKLVFIQNKLEEFYGPTIINVCKLPLKPGLSSGPQFVLQDGEVKILGINSFVFANPLYLIGSVAFDLQNSRIRDKLKLENRHLNCFI